MEFRQLNYFLEICNEKSFSKAAKNLFISQQGLSKSIKALEDELHTTLLIRSPGLLELTTAGQVLYEQADDLLRRRNLLITQMMDVRNLTTKSLIIGYAAGCFDLMPHGFLTDFMRENPHVDVVLKSFDTERYRTAIMNFRMDISICPVPYDANLYEPLFTFQREMGIVLAADHKLAGVEKIKLSDLAHVKTGFLSTSQEPGGNLTRLFSKHNIYPSILLTPAESPLLGELTAYGDVVFFYAGRMDILPESVVFRKVEGIDLSWTYHLLVNKGAYVSEPAQCFVRYAQKVLANDKP